MNHTSEMDNEMQFQSEELFIVDEIDTKPDADTELFIWISNSFQKEFDNSWYRKKSPHCNPEDLKLLLRIFVDIKSQFAKAIENIELSVYGIRDDMHSDTFNIFHRQHHPIISKFFINELARFHEELTKNKEQFLMKGFLRQLMAGFDKLLQEILDKLEEIKISIPNLNLDPQIDQNEFVMNEMSSYLKTKYIFLCNMDAQIEALNDDCLNS